MSKVSGPENTPSAEPFFEWSRKALKVINMISQDDCVEAVTARYSRGGEERVILTVEFIGQPNRGLKLVGKESSL
jgi:hypothetical protein